MTIGERGPAGDHGQSGEPGRSGTQGVQGVKGEQGERGEQGRTPILVRHATAAYSLLVVGVILSLVLSTKQGQESREQDAKVMLAFQQEAIATDRAFCSFFNYITTNGLNVDRDAIRSLEAAVRQSFELVQPPPDATATQRNRTLEFRRMILSKLDAVKVDGNLEPLDCSGIGNGEIDFSLQDAIQRATSATTTP